MNKPTAGDTLNRHGASGASAGHGIPIEEARMRHLLGVMAHGVDRAQDELDAMVEEDRRTC